MKGADPPDADGSHRKQEKLTVNQYEGRKGTERQLGRRQEGLCKTRPGEAIAWNVSF